MHDVFQVADRMIIMRRGEKVAELVTKQTNADEVVSLRPWGGDRGEKGLPREALQETFLFFIGVIVFQAALTILLSRMSPAVRTWRTRARSWRTRRPSSTTVSTRGNARSGKASSMFPMTARSAARPRTCSTAR